ncbi:hypothetical protein [Metallibacterium scheffleri]|uniref:Uncharacterized protein n=1 Tax=Metallibacterium scheffleri TaxID=993689 RepID=A0A4S3KP92_9GAMM|nr:hypothetical protein [Metallibacterium scheffleri]THD10680.1 hypothetical protein B1806_07440 [Metallibacterium scheffleri]
MTNLIESYRKLRTRIPELPEMHTGSYTMTQQTCTSEAQLWAHLAEHAPRQGWLQFQSYQLAMHGELPVRDPRWGMLLAGELVDAEGCSIAIALDADGAWLVSRFEHQATGDDLWDEVRHLAHDPKTGTLRYRRYWRHDAEAGFVQDHGCFIGFE